MFLGGEKRDSTQNLGTIVRLFLDLDFFFFLFIFSFSMARKNIRNCILSVPLLPPRDNPGEDRFKWILVFCLVILHGAGSVLLNFPSVLSTGNTTGNTLLPREEVLCKFS